MKITTCDDGFVAEVNNDEDFDKMVNLLTGRRMGQMERINKWLDETCKTISETIPYETTGAELPYMYSVLAARLLAQVTEWAKEDMDESSY